MLQRIQTIYLVLAILSLSAILLFDIAHFSDAAGNTNRLGLYNLTTADTELSSVKMSLIPVIFLSLSNALLIVAIFTYRKRKRQMQFVRFAYLTIAASIVSIFFFVNENYWALNLPEPDLSYRTGFYLPFVAFAFCWLANRAIRHDEELVRSLDRLR